MSTPNSRAHLVARRGDLMAELFLQELEPVFLSRPTSPDVGYDLLVGFPNRRGGINTFAVGVQATERPPGERFPLPRRTFDRFAGSNIPGLLLVADVKASRMYYGWLTPGQAGRPAGGSGAVSIPLTESTGEAKRELGHRLGRATGDVAAAAG